MTTDHYAEAQRLISWANDHTGRLSRSEKLPIDATIALTHAVLDIATTLRDRLPAMPVLDIATTLRDRLPAEPETVVPADSSPTYRVGDPDTTPASGPWCDAVSDYGDACTREPGHAGSHALGSGMSILAVWDDEPPAVCKAACPWEPQWACSLDTGHGGEHVALGGASDLLAHWPSAGPTVCPAVSEHGFPCTLAAGHDGRHATVSTGVRGLIAVWDDEPEPMTQAEWDALPVGTLVQIKTKPSSYWPSQLTVLRVSLGMLTGGIQESPYALAGGDQWARLMDSVTDIRVLYRPEDPS